MLRAVEWDGIEEKRSFLRDVIDRQELEGQIMPFHCHEFLFMLSPADCTRMAVAKGASDAGVVVRLDPPPAASAPASGPAPSVRLDIVFVHGTDYAEFTTTARLLQGILGRMPAPRQHQSVRVTCVGVDPSHPAFAGLRGRLVHPRSGANTTAAHGKITSVPPGAVGCERYVGVRQEHLSLALAAIGTRDDEDVDNYHHHHDDDHRSSVAVIDLTGHTLSPVSPVLRRKPRGGVLMGYHGHPGTMGMEEYDYIIADTTVAPPQHRRLFTEHLVYMNHTYFGSSYPDREPAALDDESPRPFVGALPPRGKRLYCSFNDHQKLTPGLFRLWLGILDAVPNSVLWVVAFSDDALRGLVAQAARHGHAARVVVTLRLERAIEYRAKGRCDVMLDTGVISGHTTVTDALWSGVPVVTMPATAGMMSRGGASLVKSVGLGDLVAESWDDYVHIAVRLGKNRQLLAAYRKRLAEARRNNEGPFDMQRFANSLLAASVAAEEVRAASEGAKRMHIILSG